MTSLDWFNFFAYVMIVLKTWAGDEDFVYVYNRAVIALRAV